MAKKNSKKLPEIHSKQKEPEYTVQISDPQMLRKDILEALREVILFMQGYEKFRKIQAEKVAAFHTLAAQLKSLRSLIDSKLQRYLPKGKLHPLRKVNTSPMEEQHQQEAEVVVEEEKAPPTELDELESQLRDIESQLGGMK